MTVSAVRASVRASSRDACVSIPPAAAGPRLPPSVMEPTLGRKLNGPEHVVPPPARRMGGVVAGAATPGGLTVQPLEEELEQPGVAGHAGHAPHQYLAYCRRAAEGRVRLDLPKLEGPP